MISSLKAYVSDTRDPYYNLATEEFLTFSVGADECILYLWQNGNTVVIGKNQNAYRECNVTKLEEDGGHLARRLSGGGAVYHDMGNLNFTFCVRKDNYDLTKQLNVIVEAVNSFGVKALLTGRNDITGAKVARDDSYLYFMAECADNITSYKDKAWMRLFIDTGDSNKNWEGFEYVLNRVSPSSTEATLEKSTGGWNFSTVGKVSYKVNGKYLFVKIPKSYLGISGDTFTVNFNWNDNMQKDGDLMDVYNNGDTAPGGRFMYSYVVK